MSEQIREEFEAWVIGHHIGASLDGEVWTDDSCAALFGKFVYDDWDVQNSWASWQASRETPDIHPLRQTLRENGDLIAAQATIAQQAQMIEHLRGGPTPGYTAVDMTTAAAQGFRDGAASKEKIIDALLNHCDDGECYTCGQIICPHGEPLHFHHDGCPACAQDEAE